MGLDQFMNCVSGDGKEYYWRKHARLQQFMSQKWAEQNPSTEPNGSFDWGQQFQEEQVKEYKAQDKEAIDWCKAMLEKGETVQYSCSW